LFVNFGWVRRFTVLGVELDECSACGQGCEHVVDRETNWGHARSSDLPGIAPRRPARSPRLVSGRFAAAALMLGLVGFFVASAASAAAATTTHTKNLYRADGFRFQNPDLTACIAASTLDMLNMIALNGTGGPGFKWKPTRAYWIQERILTWERSHDTLDARLSGSDPHGWKNSLNYFGYGSINAGVYADKSYRTFDAASKAAVIYLARSNKPVGISALQGTHAQFMTGYKVTGGDPAVTSAFTIVGVYISDPYRWYGHVNTFVSLRTWHYDAASLLRFGSRTTRHSPGRDPIDHMVGNTEWFQRWVIIAPVGSPKPPPVPTPSPDPSPAPVPTPSPDSSPAPVPTPSPDPSPAPVPTPSTDPSPAPTATN
jgi:hypothetical protein